ncbi:MAG: D-lysine 5,6-aminomutase subunit alpha, partial [Tissierellia bacterium]|nr:D-lysine 5,6-aminomutase subunit alpha [Tissierellia bacterium]
MSKLNLDKSLIDRSRNAAKNIAEEVQKFIDAHTTTATERTIVRLLGVDGVDEIDKPLPNVVVDNIKEGGGLERGAAYWIGNAILNTGLTPQEIAEKIATGEIDITRLPAQDEGKIRETVYEIAKKTVERIKGNREKRDEYIRTLGEGKRPYLYVIVATGNIYEDIIQAQAAARQGADVIAVIRTTGQSLLDYVPYGPTTEGFGGTYATQENFRLMRKALDEVGEEVGRY